VRTPGAPWGAYFDKARGIEYSVQVRRLTLIRVLFAILAVQLAFGLELDVAYAMPPGTHTMAVHESGGQHEDCPLHSAVSAHVAGAAAAHTAPSQIPHGLPGKHDCCKSTCQCQCGNLPFACDLSLIRILPVTVYVQPLPVSRVANAPADTHFRPPIAA
jgi:hypothetical protein